MRLKNVSTIFLVIWTVCIIVFIATMTVFPAKTDGSYAEPANSLLGLSLIVGFSSVLIRVLFEVVNTTRNKIVAKYSNHKKIIKNLNYVQKPLLNRILKSFFVAAFLPIVAPIRMARRKHTFIGKTVALCVTFALTVPLWLAVWIGTPLLLIGSYYVIGTKLNESGMADIPIPTTNQILGNSMNPTFTDKQYVHFNRYFGKKTLERGDIIIFSNNKTIQKGQKVDYIKRIIGLPGENIVLRNGFVTINGQVLNEPYLTNGSSTYQTNQTHYCEKIALPNDSYFVLGDNRTHSADSREFGLVRKKDISAILQYRNTQKGKKKKLPNFSPLVFSINPSNILAEINKLRVENKLKPLKNNDKIDKAAQLRAEAIASTNDWSLEATMSGMTMYKALAQAGYSNIVLSEVFEGNYLKDSDFAKSWISHDNTKKILLNPDFQETGIASATGKLGDCDSVVISSIFAGYVPPNYKHGDIEGWKNNLNRLREVQPNWEKVKTWGKFYDDNKTDVDRITSIIGQRINYISAIVARMEANQWLTSEERKMTEQDQGLYNEQEALATKLNSKSQ